MDTTGKHFQKRAAILDYMHACKCHPSAEEVYAYLKPQIPALSLGTVYRNLGMFKEQGAVRSVGFVQGTERFDGDLSPHAHFICRCCGKIIDLPDLAVTQRLTTQAEAAIGGTVENGFLTFYGRCKECNESKPTVRGTEKS